MAIEDADDIVMYPALPVDGSPPRDRMSKATRKFDTRLIDEWNKEYPKMTSNPSLHRMIFESYISECVKGSEPSISVINKVDAESIPPNFEFQYSNDMLYHAAVPEPELGKGCDCEGPCSESSRTCSCLKQQNLYNYDCSEGFAYDKKGLLKAGTDLSIWECGPNCGCPPECMNRVVQKGRGDRALIDLFKTVRPSIRDFVVRS
jgi:histone-lysine N-methyltransferase SUV39H